MELVIQNETDGRERRLTIREPTAGMRKDGAVVGMWVWPCASHEHHGSAGIGLTKEEVLSVVATMLSLADPTTGMSNLSERCRIPWDSEEQAIKFWNDLRELFADEQPTEDNCD